LMKHIYEIAAVAGTLIVVFGALQKFSTAFKAYQEFKALGKDRGSSFDKPMFVTEGIGGGKGGADADTTGGKKGGKFGRLGGLAKGGVAALGGVALGYGADALTEAGHVKSGAAAGVGAEALTYGGTGAMIGSVIPGLGTAIGGAIGAALGTGIGLYKNWGTLFGGDSKAGGAAPPVTATPAGAKPPPAAPATAQAAPAPTAPAAPAAPAAHPSSGVNYNASPEQMLKQFAKSQGVTGTAKPIPTTTGQVQAVTDQMKADAEKKAAEAKAAAEKEAAEKAKQPGAPAGGTPATPTQENPTTMIATLNTTMAQLLKTNKELLSISEKQLSVQRQFTGDVFTV
jgi:pyruvate/2-oxoglutarate dehydrogenase complex dihydrolipoamide acyltransferase (E2) component